MRDDPLEDFRVRFVLSRGLGEHLVDGQEYVTECRGEIRGWRDVGGDGDEIPVGAITAYRIHAGHAGEEGVDLDYECDAIDAATHEFCHAFHEADGRFREDVQEQFPDAVVSGPDLLVLDRIRVDPAFRGRGIGLRATLRTIDLLAGGCGLVAMKPFPRQFESVGEGPARTDDLRAGLSTDRAQAWRALETYWARLGFERVGNSPYFAICPANRRPGMADVAGSQGLP